jgi:hypothetical protein
MNVSKIRFESALIREVFMLNQEFFMKYASGCYWIVRGPHKDSVYTAPVKTNAAGCIIFNCLSKGLSADDAAFHLSEKYHISYEEALQDTNEFLTLLENIGCYTI